MHVTGSRAAGPGVHRGVNADLAGTGNRTDTFDALADAEHELTYDVHARSHLQRRRPGPRITPAGPSPGGPPGFGRPGAASDLRTYSERVLNQAKDVSEAP
jgi:hypothetical protein